MKPNATEYLANFVLPKVIWVLLKFLDNTEMLDLACEDNWVGLMEWKCASVSERAPVFGAFGNCVHIFFHLLLSAEWCIVTCLSLTGSFRQSQPGVQSCGRDRDVRPEWQRSWAGQTIHNSSVWLLLHWTGQYVFKSPLVSACTEICSLSTFKILYVKTVELTAAFLCFCSAGTSFSLCENGTIPVKIVAVY